MNTPIFKISPITESEKQTALYLLRGLTIKEISNYRNLSFEAIQSHAKRIRYKMEASTIQGALGRMLALGLISADELMSCLPPGWEVLISSSYQPVRR